VPAYVRIADYLREQVSRVEDGEEARMPTESEVTQAFGVSRYTARRAYAELVGEGLVERTAGKGTFPLRSSRFLMSVASVDDLVALSEDRQIEVLSPLARIHKPSAATKLGLPTDDVAFVSYRLLRQNEPFAVTRIYVPDHISSLLADAQVLHRKGAIGKETVVSILNRKLQHPIAMAKQMITAVAATPDVAEAIDVVPDQPLLKIEYLYFDTDARPVQLAINLYNPDRYEYRAQLPSRVP
jgi:DNA-binding GntR family transcriptional regulator